jgi:hypothetical protein
MSILSIYSCCSHLEYRASVKRFVSLQFLNVRQSIGLLGRGIRPVQGHYLHRTTQTPKKRRQTSINALSGIRTHVRSVRAGEDISCLRPRGHRDRQFLYYFPLNSWYSDGLRAGRPGEAGVRVPVG